MVDIRFLLLPEKDDPDTFVRSQGADAFRALAAGAVSLPDFFVEELDERVDFANARRPRTLRCHRETDVAPTARRQLSRDDPRDAARQDGSCRRTSSASSWRTLPHPSSRNAAPAPTATSGVKRKTVVQKVINIALHFPHAVARTADPNRLAALNQPGADLLRRVFAAASSAGDRSAAQVLESLRDDPDFQYLERIAAEHPLAIETDDDAAEGAERLARASRQGCSTGRGRTSRAGAHAWDGRSLSRESWVTKPARSGSAGRVTKAGPGKSSGNREVGRLTERRWSWNQSLAI